MTNNEKLKLSVGYPCFNSISFYDSIAPYLYNIGEIYFGVNEFESGRAEIKGYRHDAEKQLSELARFQKSGLKLNLLMNGNCYGEQAASPQLAKRVKNTAEELFKHIKIDSITTASPFIAHTVKKLFPKIEIRASVNTMIDGVFGMEQCKDLFDSFYVKRDYNYCIDEIKNERRWCDENEKKLYLLANSGCIPSCSHHIFHDNMISHSKGLENKSEDCDFEPFACRKLFSKKESRYLILSGNAVRPEDIDNYSDLVDGIKLATRIHPYSAIIIGAYAKRRWNGDICDLTEPGFGDLFAGKKLENRNIPNDFWKMKTSCMRAKNHGNAAHCINCGYCKKLYEQTVE